MPFGVLLLSFGKAKSLPEGFMHQNGVTTSIRIKEVKIVGALSQSLLDIM